MCLSFDGIAKPDALKDPFSCCWSRRVDGVNHWICALEYERWSLMACRFHDEP